MQFVQMLNTPVASRNNYVGIECLDRRSQRVDWCKSAVMKNMFHPAHFLDRMTRGGTEYANAAPHSAKGNRQACNDGPAIRVCEQNPGTCKDMFFQTHVGFVHYC